MTFSVGLIGLSSAKKFSPLCLIQYPPVQMTNWIPAKFLFCKLTSTIFFREKGGKKGVWLVYVFNPWIHNSRTVKQCTCINNLKGSIPCKVISKIALTCSRNQFWVFWSYLSCGGSFHNIAKSDNETKKTCNCCNRGLRIWNYKTHQPLTWRGLTYTPVKHRNTFCVCSNENVFFFFYQQN